jgi:hypothetical protein
MDNNDGFQLQRGSGMTSIVMSDMLAFITAKNTTTYSDKI